MSDNNRGPLIKIVRNGPYLISGNVPMSRQLIGINEKGDSEEWVESEKYPRQEEYALCRCGSSKTKPYCDGSHSVTNFIGTETASKKSYLEQAYQIDGPDLILLDQENLCAFARFCDQKGGVWDRTLHTNNVETKREVIQAACNCPAGRLVAWDKQTNTAIEPELEPSIGIVYDTHKKIGGPIWVRGGIPIESSDGTPYEIRNRVTLCRCGKSHNKPYCDGTHASIDFQDK